MGAIVTDQADLNEEFGSLRDLVTGLGYTASKDEYLTNDLEDYVLGYLEVDLGMGLFVMWEGSAEGSDCINLSTIEGVAMWSLEFPVTRAKFFSYLDELDLRVQRMRAILEIPSVEEWKESVENGDENMVVAALAHLFWRTEDDVVSQLGPRLAPVDSDVGGLSSNPVRYLQWRDEFVIGLDDQYVWLCPHFPW